MNFTCPYCNQPTTITTPNFDSEWTLIDIAKNHLTHGEKIGFRYLAIACPNQKCKQLFLTIDLKQTDSDQYNVNRVESQRVIEHWQLLPESTARPQPDYIPAQLVGDYQESCRIKPLSPKASATLARRCLQGMIRDFWGITKSTLKQEIDALESRVSTEVWDAIDAVRSVGNIGAHMEEDVNLIVDIEPDEADLLIGLIEDLFSDWYVLRHDRQQRQQKIKALAAEKQEQRKKQEQAGM